VFFSSEIQATDSTCNRMEREDRGCEDRSRHGEPPERERHHRRRAGMQDEIHQVISAGVVAPEAVLHPEGAVQQRINAAAWAFRARTRSATARAGSGAPGG